MKKDNRTSEQKVALKKLVVLFFVIPMIGVILCAIAIGKDIPLLALPALVLILSGFVTIPIFVLIPLQKQIIKIK